MALNKTLERSVDGDEKLSKQDKERRKAALLRAKAAGKEYLDFIVEQLEKDKVFKNIGFALKNGDETAVQYLVWQEGYKAGLDQLNTYLT